MQSTGTMIIDVPTTSVDAPARSAWWLILRRPTLAVQFLIASLVVLVAGMAVIGSWVGAQIEAGVLDHDAATAAFLIDSVISPRLQVLAAKTQLDDADIAQVDWLMDATLGGQGVVEVKIWSTDGTVLYSRRSPPLIGQHFGVDEDLRQALRGEVNANISDLRDAENEYERNDFSRLLQVYVPIHQSSDGHIIGVTDFYQPTDDLDADINAAELSQRERQVLELVATGLSNQAIGQRLGLAEKTVKHYMTNILTKLQVRSRVEAALLAHRAGLTA
jgi:DNA-binding CsgD family transcriptional regulator